ncbi:MAG: hypothetical protein SV062_10355, partial [Thermodesulfobacteriota bacterium]|nr:hypothetical protein [Thermodesulfobacteriota bacterium]
MSYSLKWLKIRIFTVQLLFLILFSAIAFRAYQIQVSKRSFYEDYSERQTNKFIKINPKRGDIYDRNYKALAISTSSYSVYAQSRNIKNIDSVTRRLAGILQIRPEVLRDKFKSKDTFVYLARKISPGKAKKVEKLNISGIGIIP